MDNSKFISVLNSSGKNKKEIMDAVGLSYTGFDRSVSRNTMKVATLELFCIATETHISEFFPDWTLEKGSGKIPTKVSESIHKYESNYNSSINELIQAKDALIREQEERIKEQRELIHLFKTGKIKLAD